MRRSFKWKGYDFSLLYILCRIRESKGRGPWYITGACRYSGPIRRIGNYLRPKSKGTGPPLSISLGFQPKIMSASRLRFSLLIGITSRIVSGSGSACSVS